jgi:hypothetical protein
MTTSQWQATTASDDNKQQQQYVTINQLVATIARYGGKQQQQAATATTKASYSRAQKLQKMTILSHWGTIITVLIIITMPLKSLGSTASGNSGGDVLACKTIQGNKQ